MGDLSLFTWELGEAVVKPMGVSAVGRGRKWEGCWDESVFGMGSHDRLCGQMSCGNSPSIMFIAFGSSISSSQRLIILSS